MNAFQFLSAQQWVEHLGWTLIHFLWQGTLIGAIYAVARRSRTPQRRYVLACAALAAMVAAPIVTYIVITPAPAPANPYVGTIPVSSAVADSAFTPPATLPPTARVFHEDVMPWLVLSWFAGAIVFWARLTGSWIVAARMRSMFARPAPVEWQRKLNELRSRIRISQPVRLLTSALVQVPTVIGWLRPVILMPIGVLAGLPTEHVEALLAHELAHIRRHDYLINVLQSTAEALLFYHPAVWWISTQIRNERELCCDDVAVAISGDALIYARALADLESCRPAHFNPALAASGGLLPDRIARLLGVTRPTSRIFPATAVILPTALIVIAAYGLFAQPAAPLSSAQQATFDVASVKVVPVFSPSANRGCGNPEPGRIDYGSWPMSLLLRDAYGVKVDQISGPNWISDVSNHYEILGTFPVGTSREKCQEMLRSLLTERFHLVVHHETKGFPGYDLVVTKDGAKLKATADSNLVAPETLTPLNGLPRNRNGLPILPPGHLVVTDLRGNPKRVIYQAESMAEFADNLGDLIVTQSVNMADLFSGKAAFPGAPRPRIANKTDLAGMYDFTLEFSDTSADLIGETEKLRPDLFQAIEKQLGLKLLKASSVPVDVVVIDHIDKLPTPN